MKIALLFGLAFVLSACVVEERYPPYVSRYDQRDVVIYDSPRYVPPPRYHRWQHQPYHHHHNSDRVVVRY
ncbi:MAG: hypothetical protein KF798_01215 [Candidatus Paracaedibacteraceae bacterium]|nr:hypothetical protein [Candidatus Paracaedibacteraceae bacterium]